MIEALALIKKLVDTAAQAKSNKKAIAALVARIDRRIRPALDRFRQNPATSQLAALKDFVAFLQECRDTIAKMSQLGVWQWAKRHLKADNYKNEISALSDRLNEHVLDLGLNLQAPAAAGQADPATAAVDEDVAMLEAEAEDLDDALAVANTMLRDPEEKVDAARVIEEASRRQVATKSSIAEKKQRRHSDQDDSIEQYWNIPPNLVTKGAQIGAGAFGKVYRCEYGAAVCVEGTARSPHG